MSACFLITGLLKESYVNQLCDNYKEIHTSLKIVSTWKDSDINLIEKLTQSGFQIVLNEQPLIKRSSNYQSTCICSGLLYAKKMGHKNVIRLRTDMSSKQINKLYALMLYVLDSNNKILCISGMCGPDDFYFNDTLLAGTIDILQDFLSPIQPEDDERGSEKFWQETKSKIVNLNKDNLKELFNFVGILLMNHNIIITWLEKGWDLIPCYCSPSNKIVWY